MGSRAKKDRRKTGSAKEIKKMKRESQMMGFQKNGSDEMQYFNPIKHVMSAKTYKSDEGKEVLRGVAERFESYLKQQFENGENK